MSKTAPSCSTRLAAHENCWSVIFGDTRSFAPVFENGGTA